MFKPHMKISEYIIRPDLPVPVDVMDKIYEYHAVPVSRVREEMKAPVFVSQNSGYRPEQHEISKGRSLTSEHMFKPIDRPGSEGYGAADYTADSDDMGSFLRLMAELTDYTRLCLYPNVSTPFFHCDYRYFGSETTFFISRRNSWHASSLEEILSIL